MQRTAFRQPTREPRPSPGPRAKRCCECGTDYQPARMGQRVCSVTCAVTYAANVERKRRAKEAKAERAADKAKRVALKSRQDWLREAQASFNAFIRARDAALPCISCGRFHDGAYDAGHYRSVGAQPALRFDETNVHRQCVPCNQHKAGNVVEYRIRLLQKIGREAVELLEIEHEPAKYTIEDAQRIKATYRAKLKAITETP